ncbi:MAG: TonB-dependent receptor plug domain-containing protein [Saprospiraceae bacterium]|nr:TonB-dependent receptor plug domain-containing protein [Saprospiraceae bacterium]
MRLLGVLCIILIFKPCSHGQDTLLHLPEALVRDIRFEKRGFNARYADTLPLIAPLTLADRLLLDNSIAIRNSAPGALATLSLRGAGPSRTVVLWQGLPLQSPQNGVIDANLIPFWPDDRVEIRPGGQSASLSSGAMGGAVLLEPSWNAQSASVAVGLSAGSFDRFSTDADIQFKKRALNARLRGAWQRAQNDFSFQNSALIGRPQQRQQNNALQKTDIQQYMLWAPNAKHVVKTAVWFMQAEREIPPSMTESPNDNQQWDKALRAVASWEYRPSKQSGWMTKAALTRESIAFRYNGDIDSSAARSVLFGTEYLRLFRKGWQWRAGVSGWLQQGRADGYQDTLRWQGFQRWQGFTAVSQTFGLTKLSLLLRQEVTDGKLTPFVWSLGAEHDLKQFGLVKSHFSRNYNLPTLNDRLWAVWGNPDLLPENGLSGDLGWHKSSGGWQLAITHFQLLLNNWILWQPSGAIFTPDNLRKVWSRGGEGSLAFRQNITPQLAYRFSTQYQWVRATNIAVNQGAETTLHRQLPYTPEHLGSASVGLIHRHWSASYIHQFTGRRFANGDNSTQVEGYQLAHLLFQADMKWRNHVTSAIFFRIENLWDEPYTVIRFYPMPGRSWQAGVRFSVE